MSLVPAVSRVSTSGAQTLIELGEKLVNRLPANYAVLCPKVRRQGATPKPVMTLGEFWGRYMWGVLGTLYATASGMTEK
jgi:hypothetical protein